LPDILDPRDERPRVRAALEHWFAFQQRVGLDPKGARRLLCESDGIEGALRRAPELGRNRARGFNASLQRLLGSGATVLPILSPAYPERLKRLSDAPPLLLVRGDPLALAAPAVAIVGSRAATVYGLSAARAFAGELARAGLVIVSGLAFGVDAAAHRAALEVGGRTIAVQGCGIDVVYPAAHSELASEIAGSGAVVSEFVLGTRPLKAFFPLRNRTISGLARAVIVVEARERSGSLITARLAADQGIDVFAVPGPITASTSVGTNQLLREGAWVAADPSDVLEVLEIDAASPVERAAQHRHAAAQATRILEALHVRPESRDGLARRLRCAPDQLTLDLLQLELDGRVAEDRDGRLRAVVPVRASVRAPRRPMRDS
jgi:DNA processing protein